MTTFQKIYHYFGYLKNIFLSLQKSLWRILEAFLLIFCLLRIGKKNHIRLLVFAQDVMQTVKGQNIGLFF